MKCEIIDWRKEQNMKEVFQGYGGVIITIIAILTLIVVIRAIIGTDENGIIGDAFNNLVTDFLNKAQGAYPEG